MWKFVSVSDPIDEVGPIAGVLTGVTAVAMQPFSGNPAYGPVNADGGKAYLGGYRAERNALLKFIADNQIKNVVFLSTDDHQNRINEVLYSPSGRTGPGSVGFAQSDYVKVPYCFSIVCGPLGATGPDLFKNHDWASIQGAANLVADAETAAGVEPIGLKGYPGLHDVKRDQNGILVAEPTPQAADFYSPDTFNFDVLDVTADGRTLTVASFGMSATPQNAGLEYPDGPPAHTILTFQVDASTRPDITFSGFVLDRRTNKMLQRVTVVNHGMAPIIGPIYLALDSLSANTSLANSVGSTENALPTGSPYVKVSSGSLAPGASVIVDLQFTRPLSGGINYHPRSVSGLLTP